MSHRGVGAGPVASASLSHPAGQPFVKTFNLAVFHKDVLDECTELTLTIQPPDRVDQNWRPDTMYDLSDSLGESGVEIKKPCLQQFADRPVIATCTGTLKKSEERSELRISEHYYDILTIGASDGHMRDCLTFGGDWKAVAVDGKKLQDARINDAVRELEGSTKVN